MNKPAANEPSMDEILSSIRQIIADDDVATENEAPPAVSKPVSEPAETAVPSFDAFTSEETSEEIGATKPDTGAQAETNEEPLALSLDQVVEGDEVPETDFKDDLPEGETEAEEDVNYGVPDDVAFVTTEGGYTDSEIAGIDAGLTGSATMPDPNLSGALAEHLLDSTTQAAASHAFARLGALGLGAEGQTIEGVVRELLRPMLKSWLDENLPSVVERLVEREIERVSRGDR